MYLKIKRELFQIWDFIDKKWISHQSMSHSIISKKDHYPIMQTKQREIVCA